MDISIIITELICFFNFFSVFNFIRVFLTKLKSVYVLKLKGLSDKKLGNTGLRLHLKAMRKELIMKVLIVCRTNPTLQN